jgi:hypothetical protein
MMKSVEVCTHGIVFLGIEASLGNGMGLQTRTG